jgi:putative tryptophan/tyrosine transport system substrate-binding protein
VKRRAFITLLGGAAAAWPLAARAQQSERMRLIGVLSGIAADDPDLRNRIAAFQQELQKLGWTEGRNMRIDFREGDADAARYRKQAAELAALAPDVILTTGGVSTTVMMQATSTIPIVFTNFTDPIGSGVVDNLARPSGNATGFVLFEYSMGGKWLELLKQIAPGTKRVAVLRDPSLMPVSGVWAAIQTAAPSFGVESIPHNLRNAAEIERTLKAFAEVPNGSLIVPPSLLFYRHRDLIVALAAHHKLPAVYFENFVVRDGGGLMSYGPDSVHQYRQAAGYVDRILKGEKPGNLPVQQPTKFELAINVKTAKALGLAVPATLLATADEIIE